MQSLKHLMSTLKFGVLYDSRGKVRKRFCGSWQRDREPRAGRLSHPGCAGQEGCPCSLADKARWRTSCSGWTENQQTAHASLWAAPRSARWRPPNRSVDPREGLWAPKPAPVWQRSRREEIRTGRHGESPASFPTVELLRRAGNSLHSGRLEAGRSGLWRPIPSGHTALSAFRRIFFPATPLNISRLDFTKKVSGYKVSSRMRVYLLLRWEALVRCLEQCMGEFEQE